MVGLLTLDFDSSPDLRVVRSSPESGSTLSTEMLKILFSLSFTKQNKTPSTKKQNQKNYNEQ